ncbi:MAG: Uncharacterised protein [Formosa sp. Hel3_A1_48]|nr:MAG: Uncharacterised protein [Formosa sp. Hel3_A1_48]
MALNAGVQVPVTPLRSVAGKGLGSPSQIAGIGSKMAEPTGNTVISISSVIASPHSSSMVTVYVVVVVGVSVGFAILTLLTPALGVQV